MNTPENKPLMQLRQTLFDYFNLNELYDLCNVLGIRYEELPHATLPEMTRELVAYCQRRNRVSELAVKVLEERSHTLPKLLPILLQPYKGYIVRENMERAYRAIVPPEWHYLAREDEAEILMEIIDKLQDPPTYPKREVPLLLEFVEVLATFHRHSPIAYELQQWVNIVAQKQGIDQEKVIEWRRVIRERMQMSQPGHPHSPLSILVKVKPDSSYDHLFHVEVWFWKSPQDIEILYASDQPLTSEQLRVELNHLHTKIRKSISDLEEGIRIEFFLPRELLYSRFEDWYIQIGLDIEVPVGIEYCVVVRSLERIEAWDLLSGRWKNRWQRWERCARQLEAIPAKAVFKPEALERLVQRFTFKNVKNHLYADLVDNDVLCVTFILVAFIHTDHPKDIHTSIFTPILVAGVPIAFWLCPDIAPSDQLYQKFAEFVTMDNLFTLPVQVRNKRREAMNSPEPDHLGKYVRLFWDDPNRLPFHEQYDNQLRSPAEAG